MRDALFAYHLPLIIFVFHKPYRQSFSSRFLFLLQIWLLLNSGCFFPLFISQCCLLLIYQFELLTTHTLQHHYCFLALKNTRKRHGRIEWRYSLFLKDSKWVFVLNISRGKEICFFMLGNHRKLPSNPSFRPINYHREEPPYIYIFHTSKQSNQLTA